MRHILLSLLVVSTCWTNAVFGIDADRLSPAGAKGDGCTDDTAAFQKALDAAGEGGAIVSVPKGKYLIKGHLTIPANVTLEGIWRAPSNGRPFDAGSVLLAMEGQRNADGPPFITLNTNSTLSGLTIFYPEQVIANPPHAYPWTVQAAEGADNCSIVNVTMINPYQAVDFGTHVTGRHFINGLYAHALYKGLYVNQCYDVGRIEDVHFWPFWDLNPESPLWAFTKENAVAYTFGRTDGEMAFNCFSIFYKIGMHFIAGPVGKGKTAPGSGVYTNCYMDVTPCAVRVDEVMENAGVSFVNGMFMSGVELGADNRGQVKFTACGFWANRGLVSHAKLEGRGAVTFDACHFSNWDQGKTGAACIDANNARVLITACEFSTERADHVKVALGPHIRSAVVSSNLMPFGALITNHAPPEADVQIGLNASESNAACVKKWLVVGPFPNFDVYRPQGSQSSRAGFDTDYLSPLGGESAATITPATKVSYKDTDEKTGTASAQVVEANADNLVDFMALYGLGKRVAYAFCYVDTDADQEGRFELGANDSSKVWVNGKLVHSHWDEEGGDSKPGAYHFTARLHKGRNAVLVKVEDAGGRKWEFVLEAYDEKGRPLKTSVE